MIVKIKNKKQAETVIDFMNILRDNNIVARNNGYLIVDLNTGYCCNVTNEEQKERFLRCNPKEEEISFEQFVQDVIIKMYKEKQKLIYQLLSDHGNRKFK